MTMSLESYTTTQLIEFSGATSRQLTYWARHNIVKPSVQQSHGPGTRRLYSFDDLIQLRLILRLKEEGWSLQKIRKAIINLQEIINDPDPLKYAMLAGGKKNILALYKTNVGERHLAEVLTGVGQQVLPIALETLEKEIRDSLTRFAGNGK